MAKPTPWIFEVNGRSEKERKKIGFSFLMRKKEKRFLFGVLVPKKRW